MSSLYPDSFFTDSMCMGSYLIQTEQSALYK